VRCAKCGTNNSSTNNFCAKCGNALAKHCAKCQAENPPTSDFCGKCGTRLTDGPNAAVATSFPQGSAPNIRVTPEQPDGSTALDGERKTVTALFADIKGSTALMEGLDPEAAHAIVEPVLRLMIEAVHRYEGYIARSTGDGIFALFGAPVAHEDHPQRALYAALRLQEELKQYATKLREAGNLPIEARVGVNTGEVVAYTVETDGKVEYRLVGHTANLASRMEALAPTGSIAISEDTRRLVEGYFALKALGPTIVKGVAEPVNVYEVTGLGPLRTRLQRSAGRGLTKFVGREREMEALKHAAEQAKSGHGQIVAAMAEPGVGKSRLYFEFKATSQSGWMVLETFSVSHGKASAYLPVIDLLRNYFDISAGDDERKRREKVTGRVLALDRSFEDTLPYLFSLLGIVEGDDPLAQMDGQVKKRRMLDAIKRILLRESLNQPLMVIFEDLHWIDEQTQELLNLLADSIGTAKLLLLVNYRPEYSHQWNSKTYYTQLRLDPLGRASAEEMLSAMLGDDKDLLPLKRLIVERTEGTPFFMEEIVQALFEDGVLRRDGTVKLAKSLGAVKVPVSVQGVLAARIDRLSAEEKELLQTLAVLGREFPLGLVRRVMLTPDDDLNRMLSALQLAEFIYEQPAVGDTEYIFKHALTQEVAYNSVLIERRRATHQRTADAIAAMFKERLEDHFSELARHYLLTTDYANAIRYSQAAAQQAANRLAFAEAVSNVEAALRLLEKLPDDFDRMRVELALRTTQHVVATVVHGLASHERQRVIERMCELGERLGEASVQLHGLVNLAYTYFPRGEALQSFEIGERCLKLADGEEDAGALSSAHMAAAFGAHACGHFDIAVPHYQEAILYAKRAKGRGFVGLLDPWTESATQLACVLQLLGRSGEAVLLAQEGLRHAREVQNLFSLGLGESVVSWLHQYRREPRIVLTHAEVAIALADEHGFPEWMAWGIFHRGWALAELGEIERGVAGMEEGIAGFDRLGGVPRKQFAEAMLAQGYQRLGRHDEALAIFDRALAHVERSGEMLDTAEILRLKGELVLSHNGIPAEAEDCFRRAIKLAVAQKARWWELRATMSLARLLASQGRRDEARTMLAAIYNWFTEGFDTADLKDAKALLDELGN
jgi:class 3 adenylate cyclase/tetratricopeptide (TPR) repeat protein